MSTPIIDCHTHTSFSDGEASFEDNVRAAAAAGCSVLVSTDHLTLPASMEAEADAQVPYARLSEHRSAFETARELAAEIAPELELVYGFECDWYPGCESNVEPWSAGATVRLGSIHWVGEAGDVAAGATGEPGTKGVALAGQPGSGSGWIDFSSDKHVWEELGADEVWRRYVSAWCQACESSLDFDVMAHPDLAMRFANEGYAASIDLTPLWRKMAECAHGCGRRVEVSTAGLRKSVGAYYPNPELLREFARAEVPITVGSDAHVATDVCWGIRDAYRYAAAAGYRRVSAPHADGTWTELELE